MEKLLLSVAFISLVVLLYIIITKELSVYLEKRGLRKLRKQVMELKKVAEEIIEAESEEKW